jgi:XXXCH domain-containing protein
MGSKNEMKQTVSIQEFPCHLRELADLIQEGQMKFFDEIIELEKLHKFKIKFSYKSYRNIVQIKVQVHPNYDATSEFEMKYKSLYFKKNKNKEKNKSCKNLKKSMQKNFKEIKETLDKGSLPDKKLIDIFYQECEEMILFPGKGDEYYDSFIDSAELLHNNVIEGNVKEAKKWLARLDYIQKDCHSLYK